jgi:hypothetical protein
VPLRDPLSNDQDDTVSGDVNGEFESVLVRDDLTVDGMMCLFRCGLEPVELNMAHVPMGWRSPGIDRISTRLFSSSSM